MLYRKQPKIMSPKPSLAYILRQTVASLAELSRLMRELQCAVNTQQAREDDVGGGDLVRMAESVLLAGRGLKSLGEIDPAIRPNIRDQRVIEGALRDGILNNRFSLVFEPIVAYRSGECYALEALLRWHDHELGAVPPARFIPIAEQTGDIVAIGRWALIEACRQGAAWPGSPAPVVSVNISPVQIADGCLVRDVCSALSDSGLPPERLQIELTENLFTADHDLVGSALAELRRAGIRIALDDFGTGFSGLSHLRGLLVDAIKIDRSFTEKLNVCDIPIVKAIVRLAQTLGLELIAEGIESSDQAETLASVGVQYLQGFLFAGHSLAAQDVGEWLRRNYSTPRVRKSTSTKTVSAARVPPAG